MNTDHAAFEKNSHPRLAAYLGRFTRPCLPDDDHNLVGSHSVQKLFPIWVDGQQFALRQQLLVLTFGLCQPLGLDLVCCSLCVNCLVLLARRQDSQKPPIRLSQSLTASQ